MLSVDAVVVMSALATVSVMTIKLFEHQKIAMKLLKTGSILCGGVGSGKSSTALAYYFAKEKPKNLYIITTARKRDTLEWERECAYFLLSTNKDVSIHGINVFVDSWNNIGKHINVKNSFFIFDEQRVVGSGSWVKSFLKITKKNSWVLLTATPGDTWLDYVPVFIANRFYKNRTEFLRRHVVYNRFTKYPKIDHYIETGRLIKFRQRILVNMKYVRPTTIYNITVITSFNQDMADQIFNKRWNVFEKKPIKNITELCYLMRKVVNSDYDRLKVIKKIIIKHSKIIIFYNFNYELDLLRELGLEMVITTAEWNGHKHESIPKTDKWLYLVQYTAGAEGWNCIETNCIIFYSQNYSYKTMIQAAGRIDRLNTPFTDLYYYHVRSKSKIDLAIAKALKQKQNFNEQRFIN
jgi:hypothetical protein